MAVFYLGNPVEKRNRMMAFKDSIYIDNDEVLASYAKRNKFYFLVGRIPFADFSVWEFLSFAKSLELRRPLRMEEARDLILRTGFDIPLRKRLKKLDPVALKAVKLATSLRPCANRICLNFDGILYSRRTFKRMQKLLNALDAFEVVVSVSDTRFVPKEGGIEWFCSTTRQSCKAKIIKKGKNAVRLFS